MSSGLRVLLSRVHVGRLRALVYARMRRLARLQTCLRLRRFSRGGFFSLGCLSTTRVPLPRSQWCIRCADPVPRLPPSPRLRSHGQTFAPPSGSGTAVRSLRSHAQLRVECAAGTSGPPKAPPLKSGGLGLQRPHLGLEAGRFPSSAAPSCELGFADPAVFGRFDAEEMWSARPGARPQPHAITRSRDGSLDRVSLLGSDPALWSSAGSADRSERPALVEGTVAGAAEHDAHRVSPVRTIDMWYLMRVR